ncbi:Cyclic pyranopterin monophosphate synthase [Streptomyces sp. YIM 121038]|uniref:pyrroloquinoline quinone biosynthesis protein PqqE n=1 Tax=Streptomyces sp. YIM 121038 TaxID=2136401 RepID=UPI0011106CBD|nr:pyrroloquinoline quinone biosynthesis protein PqqE [Streptomyces sp. YIM 121038]QCX80089.1 Cyclic pyranopterin monophosphate synthase [Streptomyces sp. YIM 121038]
MTAAAPQSAPAPQPAPGPPSAPEPRPDSVPPSPPPPEPPWALLAELTHGCPLRCSYCSNPTKLVGRSAELSGAEWADVFRQAADLGVVQTHLSGGEPLLRRDLPGIVAAADGAGIHTQLVTSGVGLHEARLAALVAAGLRSVQLSVQHTDPRAAQRIAGARASAAKERAARVVRDAGLPLGLNVVLHRANLDALDALVELGLAWGAERVELANTQFYGWALRNRDALLPHPEQVARARRTVERWRADLAGRMELVWVAPDYVDATAKPCMGGWGAVSLTVAPDGTVLPCPAAAELLGAAAPSVRERRLDWIWRSSPAFTRYRGEAWMPEPCRSCELRTVDFGGCRCQAYALTGDAARTDPACRRSPDHGIVRALVDAARGPARAAGGYAYREGGS